MLTFWGIIITVLFVKEVKIKTVNLTFLIIVISLISQNVLQQTTTTNLF